MASGIDNGVSNNAHQFIRPLGMSERFYWILDTLACTNFTIIAEIDGAISIDILKYAFSQAVTRHPQYRLRVVAGPGHRLGFYAVSVQEALEGLDISVINTVNLADAVIKEIDTPFPAGSCPMMCCRVVENIPSGRTTLLFTLHHCMTDAIGAMALVRDILADALHPQSIPFSSKTALVDLAHFTPNQESFYPARYRGWRKPFSLAKYLSAVGIDALRRVGRRPMYGGQQSSVKRTIKLLRFALEQDEAAAMIDACRVKRVTVHGLICAGLMLALRDEMGHGETTAGTKAVFATLVSSVNMRRWLNDESIADNVPGMFASMMSTNHILFPKTDPWSLARDLNHRLSAFRDRGAAHLLWQAMPPAGLLPPNEKGANRIYKLAAAAPWGPIVTNIGRIDPPLGAGEDRIASLSFAIGPGVSFPICASVACWGGRLFVNCTYDQEVFEHAFMAQVLPRMKALLTNTPDSA